jgi:TRAP transporter TAXI family solute receptor
MNKRDILRYSAFALLTAAGVGWYYFFIPHSLRVAVGPAAGEPAQVLAALAQTLEREKAPLRLTVAVHSDNDSASAALGEGKADLAVVRSDGSLPASSVAVAIAHRFIVVLAARPNSGIAKFSDLRGKSLGVIGQGPGNRKLVEMLFVFHGLHPDTTRIVPLASPDRVNTAAAQGLIDALFAAAPRGGDGIARAVAAFQSGVGSSPTLAPLDDAAALAKRNPIFTADKIAPGEIRSLPALPAEEIATVTFPSLIVARRDLADSKIYEFTKHLFMLRLTLAGQFPAAARIEALPTDRDSTFSVHPGAVTYYDASEKAFLENYSDLMWLALFGFSGVVSLAAWLFSMAFPKRREMVRSEHAELIALMETARVAPTLLDIDAIDRRIDQLVAQMSSLMFDGGIDAEQQPAFDLLLKRLGAILEMRRRELNQTAPERGSHTFRRKSSAPA